MLLKFIRSGRVGSQYKSRPAGRVGSGRVIEIWPAYNSEFCRYVRSYAKNFRVWPLWGKLFMHPVGIPCAKLRTKFEFSSSNSFEYILDSLPKSLGVTWFKPRPFWGKLFVLPLGFPKTNLCTKFEVPSSNSFEDIIDRMVKIVKGTWPKPRAFWGKLFVLPLGFPKSKLCTKVEVSSSSSF